MPTRPPTTDAAARAQSSFHADVVDAVASAVAAHPVVVVGMSVNPHVKRARRALDAAGVAHHDLDVGGYHNMWKQRLALKMWSGWPTFPQVYVRGTLVGGADEVEALIADGGLAAMLAA